MLLVKIFDNVTEKSNKRHCIAGMWLFRFSPEFSFSENTVLEDGFL